MDKFGKLALQNISDLGEEIEGHEIPKMTKDELADMNKNNLKAEIAALEEKTQNATGRSSSSCRVSSTS